MNVRYYFLLAKFQLISKRFISDFIMGEISAAWNFEA